MSFELLAPDLDDPDLTKGNPVVAKIKTDESVIYLDKDDFSDLYQSIKLYEQTIFCKDCVHSRVSNFGLSYGLSCNLECLEEFSVSEDPQDYGYKHYHHAYDTCKRATSNNAEQFMLGLRVCCIKPTVASRKVGPAKDHSGPYTLDIKEGDLFRVKSTDFKDTGFVHLMTDTVQFKQFGNVMNPYEYEIECYINAATFYDCFKVI